MFPFSSVLEEVFLEINTSGLLMEAWTRCCGRAEQGTTKGARRRRGGAGSTEEGASELDLDE